MIKDKKCLIQALLAAMVLRPRGVPYVVFLGLARSAEEESGLDAHAWMSSGRRAVTGGRRHRHYAVVAVYVYEPVMNS